MTRFSRDSMNVDGIPMSYGLINHFRETGAVDFNREIICQARYEACFSRHVLPAYEYNYLVGKVEENLVIYRALLRFYIHRNTSSVHNNLIIKLGQFNPGDTVSAYLLYYSELALSYPCKVRGAALKEFIDADRDSFTRFFPNVSPLELVHLMRASEISD